MARQSGSCELRTPRAWCCYFGDIVFRCLLVARQHPLEWHITALLEVG